MFYIDLLGGRKKTMVFNISIRYIMWEVNQCFLCDFTLQSILSAPTVLQYEEIIQIGFVLKLQGRCYSLQPRSWSQFLVKSPSKVQDVPLEINCSECWADILCRWVTEKCCLQPHWSYNTSKIRCCWAGYRLWGRYGEASLKGVENYGIFTAAYWTLSTLNEIISIASGDFWFCCKLFLFYLCLSHTCWF